MKKSKRKTGWILIGAQVSSEWDGCTHTLLEINKEDIARWKEYSKLVGEMYAKDSSVYHISCWYNTEFLNLDEGDTGWVDTEPGKSWCYVKEVETGKEYPEQSIDAQQIKIHPDNKVQFIGYGKHTSEEFWSETIDISEL